MGAKIIKALFCITLFFLIPAAFADDIVRVGITDNNFQSVKHSDVVVYATDEYMICDKATKQVIAKIPASKPVRVTHEEDSFLVNIDNEKTLGLQSFVVVSENGLIGIEGLKRKGKPAIYHGAMEFCRTKQNDGFYIINLIEMQDYLKGVVPNEMPVKFGLEALKAQTIAARNYVLAPRCKAYDEFDVVDSVASQVYFGANTEEEITNQAVDETEGQVASYKGDLILALYSSTAGGYTESYSNAFSDKYQFPAEHKPYLVAKPDMLSFVPMTKEENARAFYTSIPSAYDMDSPYFRWKRTWTLQDFETDININLKSLAQTGFITPPPQDNFIYKVKDIKVLKRGESGKIMEIEIDTERGNYIVRKELIIRRLFLNHGKALPSANFVLDIERDEAGNITNITAIGGGFGHGVGMSQYGAGFMGSKLNKNYMEILKHYYTDIVIGTQPVVVKSKPVKQKFYTADKKGIILIDNYHGVKILPVRINGLLLEIGLSGGFLQRNFEYDISKYLQEGENEVIYYPPDRGSSGKEIKVLIDLSRNEENNDGKQE